MLQCNESTILIQIIGYLLNELNEVIKVILNYSINKFPVTCSIAVNEQIPETCHFNKLLLQRAADDFLFMEYDKNVFVVLWLSQS